MQDPASPEGIFASVAGRLREAAASALPPHAALEAQVAANAPDVVRRGLAVGPHRRRCRIAGSEEIQMRKAAADPSGDPGPRRGAILGPMPHSSAPAAGSLRAAERRARTFARGPGGETATGRET